MASIERQLRKNKTRLEKRLRKDAFDAYPEESYFIPESDEEEEPSYQLVRTKRFFFRPMSIDEAILQMNLVNHTFFAFRNEDVYKRQLPPLAGGAPFFPCFPILQKMRREPLLSPHFQFLSRPYLSLIHI